MMTALRSCSCLALGLLFAQTAGQRVPPFRGGVDVVVVDARVVDRRGSPVMGLTPADFEIKVDGRVRPVVSLEYQSASAAPNQAGSQASSVLILVDQDNLRIGSSRPVLDAAAAFVEHLPPSHAVGFTLLPQGTPSIEIGADRAGVAALLRRLFGLYNANNAPGIDERAVRTALHGVIGRMTAIDGRRTVVFLTDRLDRSVTTADLAHRAALAGVVFYVVASDAPVIGADTREPTGPPGDEYDGLVGLATASGGALLRRISSADPVFERLGRELSGQYILTFAADPSGDRGRHDIIVRMKRPGMDVRARREFVR
jgi:VWFA-related protein